MEGTSLTGDVSLLVEPPFSVSDEDLRVSSCVQVADDDTEVLLLLRRRPAVVTHASLSSAVLDAGDADRGLPPSLEGLARGEAPGVPERFFVTARDALDVKRRLSLLVVLLRLIVAVSTLDVTDLVGDGPRGLDGDALALSGVVPRLLFLGDEGREEGRDDEVVSRSTEPRDSKARVGVARAELGAGLARSALAKYWWVGLRSSLMRLLL